MFDKFFKEPNRVLKITTAILIVAALAVFILWSIVDTIDVRLLSEEASMPSMDLDGMLLNKILIAAMCTFGALGIALFFCWFKIIIKEPGTTLKILLLAATVVALIVVAVMCMITVSAVSAEANQRRDDLYRRYAVADTNTERNLIEYSIADVNNNEANTIVTAILHTLAYTGGIFACFLILYGFLDCIWRAVYSLEKIANNTTQPQANTVDPIKEQNTQSAETNE